MKHGKHIIALISVSLIIPMILVLSCDIKNPTEGVEVLFNEAPLTLVTVELVDARTNQQISSAAQDSVRIVIEGSDKNYVTDLTETPATSFSSQNGFFNFAISDLRPLSPNYPLEITIRATAPEYMDTNQQISVSSTKGESFTINLIKREAPPEGITTTTSTEGSAKSDGEVVETIVVTSEPETLSMTTISMNVESGTVITDEQGEALTGALKAEIMQFDVTEEESVNAMPGGLFTTMKDKTGETADAVFVPAAVVSLEISDENGSRAKTFDTPVSVSFQISGDTHNPETGATIKGGDIVPIWNFDEVNAQWEFHSESIAAGPDENGNFELNFTITHMSYWSGGWEDDTETICDNGMTIYLTGGFTALDVKIKKRDDGAWLSSLGKSVNAEEPVVRLSKTPGNMPVTIEAWYGADIIGSIDVDDLCGEDVELAVSIPGKAVTFSVEVYDINDRHNRMRPNRGIYIDEDGAKKYVGYMADGLIKIYGLEEGREYLVWVFHENTWYSETFTVDDRTYAELDIGVDPD